MGLEYLTKSANVQTGEEEKIEGKELVFTMHIFHSRWSRFVFSLASIACRLVRERLATTAWVSNLLEGLIPPHNLGCLYGIDWQNAGNPAHFYVITALNTRLLTHSKLELN